MRRAGLGGACPWGWGCLLLLRRRCCGTAGRHRARGGARGPAPGWDARTHPASKAAHCPLMLLPGSGGGKPSGGCPLKGAPPAPCRGFERKGEFFGPARKGEKQGTVWRDAPRPAEMSGSRSLGEPGAAALQRSCCGAFCTYLTWPFLSGSRFLPKFAVKELQVRNVAPGLYL